VVALISQPSRTGAIVVAVEVLLSAGLIWVFVAYPSEARPARSSRRRSVSAPASRRRGATQRVWPLPSPRRAKGEAWQGSLL